MVVDEAGMFLSQRDHPRLALVSTKIEPGGLRVRATGMPTLELPMQPKSDEVVRVQVHDDITKGYLQAKKQETGLAISSESPAVSYSCRKKSFARSTPIMHAKATL